jgi:hypothetical protein
MFRDRTKKQFDTSAKHKDSDCMSSWRKSHDNIISAGETCHDVIHLHTMGNKPYQM